MNRFLAVFIVALAAMANVGANASTVFITGSNRGLGFEFAKQYAEKGWTVIATTRTLDRIDELRALAAEHKNVIIEQLDVANDDEIKKLAEKYKDKPIDVLLSNAGVLANHAAETLGTFDRSDFHRVADVNAYGALMVAQAFQANVAMSPTKKIIAMSSGQATIAGASRAPGGPYGYRMSKAALDIAFRTLGGDLAKAGVTVGLIAPGAAETEMLKAFLDDNNMQVKSISAAEAAGRLIEVIATLTPERAAKGINNYDGTILAW